MQLADTTSPAAKGWLFNKLPIALDTDAATCTITILTKNCQHIITKWRPHLRHRERHRDG